MILGSALEKHTLMEIQVSMFCLCDSHVDGCRLEMLNNLLLMTIGIKAFASANNELCTGTGTWSTFIANGTSAASTMEL